MLNVETQTEGIDIQVAKVGTRKSISLLRVYGFVDTTTSPQLHKVITEMIHHGYFQIIVDLGEVNYVSSAGWGVFVGEIRGIRENGGDLKIVQMTQDVNEVFEMLEFNRILTAYESLEEAVDDFDLCLGYDLRQGMMPVPEVEKTVDGNGFSPDKHSSEIDKEFTEEIIDQELNSKSDDVRTQTRFDSTKRYRSISSRTIPGYIDADLPLTEKIKKLVIEDPVNGIWTIKRLLYSPRFGYTKVGFFKLRSIMKRLNLDTRTKRYRYFRSR